jgi:DNA-binding response OmpR family regulator
VAGNEEAEHFGFDVALVDVNMPGVDGLEVIKVLARLDPPLPSIAMSGGSADPDKDYAVLASMGGKAFLHKPFTRPLLIASIQAVLRTKDPGDQ